MSAVHVESGRTLASRVERADDAASRGKGLLGRDSMGAGEGLWIVQAPLARLVPCPTIHTFFMRFPIDVLFLDGSLRVVRAIEHLSPWRLSPWVPASRSVLELKAGALAGAVRPGDRLEMRPA